MQFGVFFLYFDRQLTKECIFSIEQHIASISGALDFFESLDLVNDIVMQAGLAEIRIMFALKCIESF